ncbi:MAG: DUF1800 domain-containing protein [Gammaproteobacteria bacterium]|nr:DUF1800 domain-containing protein [Gammaproteobacteria bacterium]
MSIPHIRHIALICALTLASTGCGGGGGSEGAAPPPPPAPPPAPTVAQLQSAAKLLDRTTLGANFELIDAVAREGTQAWLDRQFTLPPTNHLPIVLRYGDLYGYNPASNPPPGTYRRFAWWERTLTAPDLLRQRIAYALTQVFVVSDNVDEIFINPLGLASYYDTLLAHAFGNYRDLLYAVTLHPVMGIYLSHVNNGKSDPAANTFPDENYAREVMQLFSIGLFELNADGSARLNSNGNPIPTYDNDDIQEFAKVFTGLSYGPGQPGGPSFFGKENPVLHVPMVMFEAFHEPGAKSLLNGVVIPAGQTGIEDIESAVDNLFNHPNVGPFFGRQLIQRLVTSNPSPAYIARVTAAFNGNATTPRGDMRSVLRAVLLDPEAANGIKLKEPFLRYVALNRALNATSDDGTYPGLGYIAQFLIQQHVLSAASVFNFYSPNFSPAGELGATQQVAPEFQITTDSTLTGARRSHGVCALHRAIHRITGRLHADSTRPVLTGSHRQRSGRARRAH